MIRDWHVFAEPSKPRTDRASRRAVEDAQGLIRSFAARIGFVERGGDIPRCCNDTVVGIERPTHMGGSNR